MIVCIAGGADETASERQYTALGTRDVLGIFLFSQCELMGNMFLCIYGHDVLAGE